MLSGDLPEEPIGLTSDKDMSCGAGGASGVRSALAAVQPAAAPADIPPAPSQAPQGRSKPSAGAPSVSDQTLPPQQWPGEAPEPCAASAAEPAYRVEEPDDTPCTRAGCVLSVTTVTRRAAGLVGRACRMAASDLLVAVRAHACLRPVPASATPCMRQHTRPLPQADLASMAPDTLLTYQGAAVTPVNCTPACIGLTLGSCASRTTTPEGKDWGRQESLTIRELRPLGGGGGGMEGAAACHRSVHACALLLGPKRPFGGVSSPWHRLHRYSLAVSDAGSPR